MNYPVTQLESAGRPEATYPASSVELPSTLREHAVLVNLAEWVSLHYPWRLAMAATVRRRLLEEAA